MRLFYIIDNSLSWTIKPVLLLMPGAAKLKNCFCPI